MRLIGVNLHKPSTIDAVFGVGLILLLAAVLLSFLGPSGVGALSGGVVSAIFGVRAYRSVTEFMMASCCGAIGALIFLAMTVAVK